MQAVAIVRRAATSDAIDAHSVVHRLGSGMT